MFMVWRLEFRFRVWGLGFMSKVWNVGFRFRFEGVSALETIWRGES